MSIEKVPFIDLLRYENGFLESVQSRVAAALQNGHFVGGPQVKSCEDKLLKATQATALSLCANGTDALQLALRALGVQSGDKVLLPDMTFWASFEAIVNVGATPITLDVEWEHFHLSLARIEEAVEKFNPRALLLVHLYGWAAPETEAIRHFCAEKSILLLEDSAQAYGTKLNGKSLIGSAPCATTSFYPAKVLGASGDAGAVFSTDVHFCSLATQLANHGRSEHYEHAYVGWNSRMGVYEAIFLEEALKFIDARIASRKKIVETYQQELRDSPLEILEPPTGVEENGYLSVGRIDSDLRPKLIQKLKEKNIGFGTVYPGAMSRQTGAKKYLNEFIDNGVAHKVSQSVINLPCFAYMTEQEQSYIIKTVKEL